MSQNQDVMRGHANKQKTRGFIKWIGAVPLYSATWKHRCVLTRHAFLALRAERLARKRSRGRVSGDRRGLSRSEARLPAAGKSKATATGRAESPFWRKPYRPTCLSTMRVLEVHCRRFKLEGSQQQQRQWKLRSTKKRGLQFDPTRATAFRALEKTRGSMHAWH